MFSRSELRKSIIENSVIEHSDPERPRVKKWSFCPHCRKPCPKYLMECDHILPIIPIGMKLEHLTWDELIDRVWCDAANLQAVCKECHKRKSSDEQKQRRIKK